MEDVSWNLTAPETSILLTELPKRCRTQITDVLVATLLMAYRDWSGNNQLTIRMEGHGREESLFGGHIDLNHTVGWNTSVYPICMTLPDTVREMPDILKTTREQLRQIPDNGIGYGILRYLGDQQTQEQLSRFDCPSLVFNYLGQFGENSEALFQFASEPHGITVAAGNRTDLRIDCNSMVVHGQLHMQISYNTTYYDKESVQTFARQYQRALTFLLASINSQHDDPIQWLIPSDVPMAHLTQEQIDRLLPTSVTDAYPLSPLQEGILFHALGDFQSGQYINCIAFVIQGKLNRNYLKAAWEKLISEHDILRTSFLWQGVDSPQQLVHNRVDLHWKELDWVDRSDWRSSLEELFVAEGARGFDLTHAALIRFYLIKVEPEKALLVLVNHDILLDGWSYSILIAKLAEYYQCQGESRPLPDPETVRYRDYISWIQNQSLLKAKEYWSAYLNEFSVPSIPSFKRALPKTKAEGSRVPHQELNFTISEELTQRLTDWVKKQGLTLNSLFQGAWGLMLQCYTGQQDIVFGNVVSGRTSGTDNIEKQVGLLINTIPMRIRFERGVSGIDYLFGIQNNLSASQQYDYARLSQIQSWTGFNVQRPLIDHIYIFENYPAAPLEQNEHALQIADPIGKEQTNYPLNLLVNIGKELRLLFIYDELFYDTADIVRMTGHIQGLLEQIIANPQGEIQNYTILTSAERQQLLHEWNDTTHEYPRDKTIYQLFEEQVNRTPDNVAVVAEDLSLTYSELNARVNRLAHCLRNKGVGAETRVAICCERSLEMITGILGILKAGGAYVPLDPGYPKERLDFMLADTNAPVLLTQSWLKTQLPPTTATIIELDQMERLLENYPTSNPHGVSGPNNLAYVIYTSGSTGRPKGVLSMHGGLVNRLLWMKQYCDIKPDDVILQKTSFMFDVSVWELLLGVISGTQTVYAKPEGHKDPAYLFGLINSKKITITHFVPSMLQGFLSQENVVCPNLKQVVTSGEALSPELLHQCKQKLPTTRIHNLYGPTEASIDVSFYDCALADTTQLVPIGKPIWNSSLYILDNALRPVPIGVTGELFIGGEGLARGYLNRPDLTAERFIPNPFSKEKGGSSKLYRTGDLCRYKEDGNIEYIGRIDHQVKIRGFRIEPTEIESALLSHPAIREAVVLAREDEPGNKRLVAYYCSAAAEVGPGSLRDHLKITLPDYMIPAAFVHMDTLPLTPNGKLDRKALPIPEGGEIRQVYVAPRTLIEEKLVAIWQEILHIDQIGIHDNFFELGGDSLLGVKLTIVIMDHFQIQFPLTELFKYQTVEKIAEYLVNRYTKTWSPIIQLNNKKDNQPIFFCPTLQGIGSVYAKLSKIIEPDFLCYALESPGYSENKTPHSNMVEMARYYIDEIKEIQKEGPYTLVGWSFGGMLAIEIAQQLVRSGNEVKKVALLDAANYCHPSLIHYFEEVPQTESNDALLNDLTITVRNIEKAHKKAITTYEINDILFPLAMIRAEDEDHLKIDDEKLGWGPYIKNTTFELYSINSKHNDMLDRAYLPEVSKMLTKILKN